MKNGLPKRFWILAWLAIGTIVLGTLGLLGPSIASGHGSSIGQRLDALLEATSYLTLNGFGPIEEGVGGWDSAAAWSTRIARLLALVFAVIGIGVVVDALLGEFGNWRFRWRAARLFGRPRQLDLVCGLAGPGQSFIDNACADNQAANRKTLAIDAAPSAHAIDVCRRRNVPLLAKDAGDEAVLAGLKLDRIKRVFVSTGSDEANLRILVRLAEQVRNGGRGDDILCVVHLADTAAYAPLLKALPQGGGLDLRVFNAESMTVRELYKRHPLYRRRSKDQGPPPVGVHLVVLGDGAMADELLLQALQLNIYELDLSLKIDVLCDDPRGSADRWQSRHAGHPHCEDLDDDGVCLKPDEVWESEKVLPKIGFHLLPNLESRQIAWCEKYCGKPNWVTTFVIALQNQSTAAAVALGLAEPLRVMRKSSDVQLWIYARNGRPDDIGCLFKRDDVADEGSNDGEDKSNNGEDKSNNGEDKSNDENKRARWIHIFRDYLGECSRDLIVAEKTEKAAKRVNHIYNMPNEKNKNSGERSGDGDEMQFLANDAKENEHWRACNEVDRESSRQAAAHAWVKQGILRRLSGQGTGPASTGEAAHDHVGKDLMLLAAIEHRRWCAEQLLAGMMPLLTTHPTSSAPGKWDAEDFEKAKTWFDKSGAEKKSWKKRNRHIDLMPFTSLAHLNAVEAGLGDKEQEKDLLLARLTDYIVEGLKGKAKSEEGHA